MPRSRSLKNDIMPEVRRIKPTTIKQLAKEMRDSGKEDMMYGKEAMMRGKLKMMAGKMAMDKKDMEV